MAKNKKPVELPYINSPLNNPMPNYGVYVLGKAENFIVRLVLFIIGGAVGLIFYGGLFKVDGYATVKTYISNIVVFIIVGFAAIKLLAPVYKLSLIHI